VIADDVSHFRRGLRAALDGDARIEIVGEADDGRQVVEAARQCWPDVVLLDVRMPRVDGIAAITALREAVPDVKVVMLTVSDSRVDVVEALEAGAVGYLLKDSSLDQVADAICRVAEGDRWPLG
jgi:two-component system NarL family response regulator